MKKILLAFGGSALLAASVLAQTPMVPAKKIMTSPPAATPASARPETLAAGAMAPDFVSLDLNGKEVRLSDFKDKIVILDFWATWCGPCIASFPHTQKVAAKYKDQGVVVLAAGTSDTIANFKNWIPANQPKYADMIFTYDPNERGSATEANRASAKLYGVAAIPTQFIIGRDRVIAAVVRGNGGADDARTETALARLGVKVDAAIVAKGGEQLKKAAEADAKRAEAAKAAAANPPPPFREDMGKLPVGSPVPDFALGSADGKDVKFSDYAKGKVAIIGIWMAGSGPADALIDQWNHLATTYANQGVVFVGIGGYDTREAFDGWLAKNAGRIKFTAAWDPAGKLTPAAKPRDQMSPEELKAETERSRDFYSKIVSMRIGGVMTPVPTTIAVNAEGKLVGWSAGFGASYRETIGNLLLRSGVKLAAADMPAKVTTDAELKKVRDDMAARAAAPRTEMIKVGAMAPDFTTQDINGKPVKLSDYRGKVVVLDFWATWCGPCIASMPHTQEVAKTYKDQGVVVLGSCTSDTREKFEGWVKANQEKYPDFIFTHDAAEKKPERASAKLYGVGGIPQQFIIDREGRIAAAVTGYLKGEVILDGALAKAGIKVDPAIVAQAEIDLKKRNAMR
jgi:thiol-disulfide isomerase/thioredoxin